MGALKDKFFEAFRDYATDGVAASGPHEPEKSTLRNLGGAIEDAIQLIGFAGVFTVRYATRAELAADLAHDDGIVALVYDDASEANNDLYLKNGANGAGDWTLTTILHDIVDGLTGISDDRAGTTAFAENAINGLGDLASSVSVPVEQRRAANTFGSLEIGGFAGAFLLTNLAPNTPVVEQLLERYYVAPTATQVRLKIFERQDGSAGTLPADSTLMFTAIYTLAELGLSPGASERKDVWLTYPEAFLKRDGYHLAWEVEALDAADARVGSSMGYKSDAALSQPERGWRYSVVGSPGLSNVGSPTTLATSVFREGRDAGTFVRHTKANILLDGANILIDGIVTQTSGVERSTGNLAPALAAAGKERIDKLVLNRSTGVISLAAGAQRNERLDALEWQAATPADSEVIGRAKVTDAAVEVVNSSGWRGLVKTEARSEQAWFIERNRAIWRPTLGKAFRGDAINLGGNGDSLISIQDGFPAFTANGPERDRGLYYLRNYPADTLERYGLGGADTSNLFDFGDGAGQLHTKIGIMWAIKAALDEIAGAETTTYLNYGQGGTRSENANGQGLWPARMAEPLGDNLDHIVIAFGMNERGQTYTYDNIVNMIGQFQAVGTKCSVWGLPRPNAAEDIGDWRYTHHSLEAAAFDTNSGFISSASIADESTIGGMGVPSTALASTNIDEGNSHPGLYELERYGQLAVMQLGLS